VTKSSPKKERLDQVLVDLGLASTRSQALALVLSGEVLVDGEVAGKAGQKVSRLSDFSLKSKNEFVSRGGLKLKKALLEFSIDPKGLTCIDIGSSTGGFCDCLLKNGAQKVVAIDVGTHQLHERIRNHPRVEVREKTNAKDLTPNDFAFLFDLAVMDVSFISAIKILPAMKPLLKSPGRLIVLIKPQFEAGLERIGRGGLVAESETHLAILGEFNRDLHQLGMNLLKLSFSPIRGHKSENIEFLGLVELSPTAVFLFEEAQIKKAVDEAHGFFKTDIKKN
jgi:23S rRNA (cytidine1920-2'-O)/16S rRNA (cytidine1409-2'-O)-methyltransferase